MYIMIQTKENTETQIVMFPLGQQYDIIKEKININREKYLSKQISADTYCNELLRLLRLINKPSKEKRLSLQECQPYIYNSYCNLYNDKQTTLSQYYINMINDSLAIIREHNTAYVFTEEQIKDILRFEPNITVQCKDDIFFVSLN